jgi:hypothetical protein
MGKQRTPPPPSRPFQNVQVTWVCPTFVGPSPGVSSISGIYGETQTHLKTLAQPGTVAHACNPSTREAEEDHEFEASWETQ